MLSIHEDFLMKILLNVTRKLPQLHHYIYQRFEDLTDGKFVVFIHNPGRLHQILTYIDRNEIGRTIFLVHCNNRNRKHYDRSFKELLLIVPILEKAGVFPQLNLHVLYKDKPFGPETIDDVSKELHVRKNRILIGSIHQSHPFDYEDLGGVRIIF